MVALKFIIFNSKKSFYLNVSCARIIYITASILLYIII